jgi:putative ABC transport system permease protein
MINLAGLTLGLTACMLIGLFIWDEKQYDQSISEGDRVYRMYIVNTDTEGEATHVGTPPMFATVLAQEFPEIQTTARAMAIQGKYLFENGEKKIYGEKGFAVDSSFFDVLPLDLANGHLKTALQDPESIVLSASMAESLFGKSDPIGKELRFEKTLCVVKGVLKPQERVHLDIGYLLPLSHTAVAVPSKRMQSWEWQQFNTYVKLKEGAEAGAVQNKFQKLVTDRVHPITKQHSYSYLPYLQSLKDIHLYSSSFVFDVAVKGNATYVKALTIVALFLLLIACFNFVNLSTAKSVQRAKEVGVRKAIGAGRKQLFLQFTSETILLALISMILSVLLTFLFLGPLNQFTGKSIYFNPLTDPFLFILLLLVGIVVGALAGFYPALVLSAFEPVRVLKGAATEVRPGKIQWLRQGLVVVQFVLSGLLIISAIVVYRQTDFLHNKDLGFRKDQILFFPMRGEKMSTNHEAFKNDLLKNPGIASVSIGYGFPGDMTAGDEIILPKNGENKSQGTTQLMVDFDYVKTLGLQVIAGRDFTKGSISDANHGFIINETAVSEFGFGTPEKALGQKMMWKVWESTMPDSLKYGEVIGVVRDFHYKSLYEKLGSAVLQIYPPAYWKVAVKLNSAKAESALSHIQSVWSKFSPEYPLEYNFLDESFSKMYVSEDKLNSLLWIFTGLAIFIGCLGLFSLVAYAAVRRTKEIGIRKVLGASVNGIVFLLSKDFLKLVVIAFLIASPIAWFLLNDWLQDFVYRISIEWWVFAIAGLVALVISFVTISMQAIRAATANPVNNLRTE